MAAALGSLLVAILLIFLGMFLSIAAYSRKPILLRLVTIGFVRINPDSPGRVQRAVVFIAGMLLILVGVLLVVAERLKDMGFI
jgi:hypothetical protein